MFAIWIHRRFKQLETLREEDKRKLEKREITLEEYNNLVEKDHADAFTLKEIMDAHRMDYEKRSDYAKAYSALAMERKDIEVYFKMFLDSAELEKSRKEGKSDDDIWRDFITAANSWSVHLLYSDLDGRYKQIDLYSYATLINRRLLAIDRELRTKGEQVRIIGEILPELIPNLRPPELDGFKDRHRMLVAHAWSCPFCENLDFPDENELKKHIKDVHKSEFI
jgi:hypothetical protein